MAYCGFKRELGEGRKPNKAGLTKCMLSLPQLERLSITLLLASSPVKSRAQETFSNLEIMQQAFSK